jgi:hypothetical protein
MTTAIAAQPFTVSTFLFGEDQDTEQALAQALHEHGVLGFMGTTLEHISEDGREAASNQVAAVAHGLLDLDLGDLVIAGWRKQGQLAAAAERTAANPGTSELVELATHRVSSVHHPYVELLINDRRVTTVNFELDLQIEVKALVATERDGHLVRLHSGDCDLSATLTAEGVRLASRRRQFDLPLAVRWPLLLHLGGGTDPLPYGAKSPPASPPPVLLPSRRRRGLRIHAPHRPHHPQPPPGPPAD